MPSHNSAPAPLWRRFAAMAYDSFLLLAIWFVLAAIINLIYTGLGLSSTTNGIPNAPTNIESSKLVVGGTILVSTWLFYDWFWRHGGQTLGMRSWKIETKSNRGVSFSRTQTLLRCLLGAASLGFFGIGYLWRFIDNDKQCLHDRLSHTATLLKTD